MIAFAEGLDRYVEPVLRCFIGAIFLYVAGLGVLLAVRRRSVGFAVRAAGALLFGAVFVLWGIGVTKDPFGDPVFSPLLIVPILLMVGGYLVGREPEERRQGPRRTPREVFKHVATLVVMLAAMLAIWWVVPRGNESTAIFGAAIVYVLASAQVRRWKARRQRQGEESAPKN